MVFYNLKEMQCNSSFYVNYRNVSELEGGKTGSSYISKTISPDSVQQKTYPCPWPSFLSVVARGTVLMELKIPCISHTSDNGTKSTLVIMTTQELVMRRNKSRQWQFCLSWYLVTKPRIRQSWNRM
jgi:hypothetical protein